jgi:ABC-2 type transport system ATP-binding protein
MLSVSHISKRYGGRTVVDDVSFEIQPGEVVALLGPNGAGKTTTLRMIAGVLEPDAGEVTLFGMRMWRGRIAAQTFLGYLPEGAPLWGEMTPLGYLRFLADVRGLPARERGRMVEDALANTALEDVLEQRIDTLSKGYRRRVALAGAILHDPQVLVLDEPTDGLDPNQKRDARALVRALAPGRVVLVSTHILEEVDAMCPRALVIAHGKIVADTTPDGLRARVPGGRLDDAFAALTTGAVPA